MYHPVGEASVREPKGRFGAGPKQARPELQPAGRAQTAGLRGVWPLSQSGLAARARACPSPHAESDRCRCLGRASKARSIHKFGACTIPTPSSSPSRARAQGGQPSGAHPGRFLKAGGQDQSRGSHARVLCLSLPPAPSSVPQVLPHLSFLPFTSFQFFRLVQLAWRKLEFFFFLFFLVLAIKSRGLNQPRTSHTS